jgi:hypothetical protein
LRRLTRASISTPRTRFLLDCWTIRYWGARNRRFAQPWQRPCDRRRLNPQFVFLLMGWPVVTLSDSPATAFALWRRRMRSAFSALS